jgi:hypothetical protein
LLPFETAVFAFTIISTGAPPASNRARGWPAALPPCSLAHHTRPCVVGLILADGRSTWLKGLTLVTVYVVLAASFVFHDDNQNLSGLRA